MKGRTWLAFGLGAAAFVTATPAFAEPATANSIQLGFGFRYGFNLESGRNPFGLGLGVDGGYTLPNALYLGGNFDYFFGERDGDSGLVMLMAEGGYDIGLGENFVIRPKAGLGFASVESSARFALAPGAKFMLFTSSVSLSVDLRYALILDDPALNGLILSVGIGF